MKQHKKNNTNGFAVGETVKIVADWIPAEVKRKRVQILHFQNNGRTFAKILWKGRNTIGYDTMYGDLWALDELRKI